MGDIIDQLDHSALIGRYRGAGSAVYHAEALLDTDILSALLRQQPTVVSRAIQYLSVFPQYTFSLITRYDILRGLKAKDAKKQLMAFDAFCQSSEIVPVTEAIISRASDLYADLHQRGQLIGDADILIGLDTFISPVFVKEGAIPRPLRPLGPAAHKNAGSGFERRRPARRPKARHRTVPAGRALRMESQGGLS